MVCDLYLNPVGLLYGAVARAAIKSGNAGRLGGGDIGFCAVQLLQGQRVESAREIRSYQDLRSSGEKTVMEVLHLLECQRVPVVETGHSGPLLMGVVNVTPDSFSDGGDFLEAASAIAHGKALAQAGADILDIGGESTRPGAEPILLQEELKRVLPVVEGLKDLPHALSIDTRKPEVMRQAVDLGADLLNDVTALSHETQSIEVARQLDRPVILMHAQGDPRTMQDNPHYEDVVVEVFNWLKQRIEAAQNAGINRDRLMIDPGIGFGKNLEHNLALLANLAFFHGLGVPVVLGASRKRFIGALSDASDARQRMPGSIAAALKGAACGVQIIRVHDVAQTRQALSVAEAIRAN